MLPPQPPPSPPPPPEATVLAKVTRLAFPFAPACFCWAGRWLLSDGGGGGGGPSLCIALPDSCSQSPRRKKRSWLPVVGPESERVRVRGGGGNLLRGMQVSHRRLSFMRWWVHAWHPASVLPKVGVGSQCQRHGQANRFQLESELYLGRFYRADNCMRALHNQLSCFGTGNVQA